MALEDLERELYTKENTLTKRKGPARKEVAGDASAPRAWGDTGFAAPAAEVPHGSPMKKLILFGIGFFVLVVAGTVTFLLLSGGTHGVNILLSVVAPDAVPRGVPFDVTVNVSNNSEAPIQDAILEISLPAGLLNLGSTEGGGVLIREQLGDIGSGAIVANRKFKFLATGAVGSIEPMDIRVSYLAGGKTRFEEKTGQKISVREAGVVLTTTLPDQVLRGGSFEMELKYKNETDYDFPNISLEAKYPGSFKFDSASLNPDMQNNYWRLGELRHGSTGKLTIRGRFEGSEDNTFGVPVKFSANFLGKDYPILEDTLSLKLAPSPVEITIFANNTPSYLARAGETIGYAIGFENKSGIALADVIVKANVSGEMFEPGSITSDGYLDPITGVLTWNATALPSLRLLQPGASGEVRFSVKLKDSFPIRKISDKNYSVRTNVKIDSPTVPFYMKAEKTSAVASLDTKVRGLLAFDQQGFYRDSTGGIVNMGIHPPSVGAATEYTIHWILKNYSTDVKNISVKASLEAGVQWTGAVKSTGDTSPIYNERTQEIVWNVEKIPATRGVISVPLEAIFQVRAIPSAAMVGRSQPLVTRAEFSAEDEFTGSALSGSDDGITTDLPDDRAFILTGGIVTQ